MRQFHALLMLLAFQTLYPMQQENLQNKIDSAIREGFVVIEPDEALFQTASTIQEHYFETCIQQSPLLNMVAELEKPENFTRLTLKHAQLYELKNKARESFFATSPLKNGIVNGFYSTHLSASPEKRLLFLLTHGTWSQNNPTYRDPHNENFQEILTFAVMFAKSLGYECDIIAYGWNGKNKSKARITAGCFLSQLVDALSERYSLAAAFAHSHGANVMNAASQSVKKLPFSYGFYLGSPVRQGTYYFTPKFSEILINAFSLYDFWQAVGSAEIDSVTPQAAQSHSALQHLETINTLKKLESKQEPPSKNISWYHYSYYRNIMSGLWGKQKKSYTTEACKSLLAYLATLTKYNKIFPDGRMYKQPQTGGTIFNVRITHEKKPLGHSELTSLVVPHLLEIFSQLHKHHVTLEKLHKNPIKHPEPTSVDQRSLLKDKLNKHFVHIITDITAHNNGIIMALPPLTESTLSLVEQSVVQESSENKKKFAHLYHGSKMDDLPSLMQIIVGLLEKIAS